MTSNYDRSTQLIFRLMFEVLWVPSFDWRGSEAVFCRYRDAANALVALLQTDGSLARTDESYRRVRSSFERLDADVRSVVVSGLFNARQCEQALQLIEQLRAELFRSESV